MNKWWFALYATVISIALLNTSFWWLVFVAMPFMWAHYFK